MVLVFMIAFAAVPLLQVQPASAAEKSFASYDPTDLTGFQAPPLTYLPDGYTYSNGPGLGEPTLLGAPDHQYCIPVPFFVKCSKEQVTNDVDAAKCAALFWTDTDACKKTQENIKREATTLLLSANVEAAMKNLRKMMINSVKRTSDFILVQELGSKNSSTNPVVSCKEAKGAAAQACSEESDWFMPSLSIMRQLGLFMIVPLIMLLIIQAAARGSMFMLLRGVLVMLPVAILGTVAAVTITQMLLNISDDLSDWLASDYTAMATYGANFNAMLDSMPLTSLGFFSLLWLLFFVVAGFAIFVELLMRQVGTYFAMLFLPLAFAAMVWPGMSKWARRLVELLFGLIFSKPMIVAAIALGMAAISQGGFGVPTDAPAATANSGTQAAPATVKVDPDAMLGAIMGGSAMLISAAFVGKKVTGLVLPYDNMQAPSKILNQFQAVSMAVNWVQNRAQMSGANAQQQYQMAQQQYQQAQQQAQPPPSPNP